jgi:AraC-like DNA-binding protein
LEGTGEASPFLSRFREAVEARLSDSDLSVDDLAADMNLSRVQLYRKVKAVTGSSPVELLRTARLNRAYQLLLTTDKSVSEVAYAVGFTAPSYFTKCFKEEYGMVPGDVRK